MRARTRNRAPVRVRLLTVFIAAYLFADGIAEVVGALRLRREAGRTWLLFGGVVSVLLGAMIWRQFPLSGAWAIGVVLGIKLLLIGAIMIAGGSAARAPGDNQDGLNVSVRLRGPATHRLPVGGALARSPASNLLDPLPKLHSAQPTGLLTVRL